MDEHNANEAEDREERRWMEKKNKGARAKRKKEDIQRLRTLVERARANDPRIKAYVKKQKAANEAKKAAKKDKVAAKYAKIASDKKAAEDAILAEKAAKADALKNAKKAKQGNAKLLKKLRRKWNKYCEELDVDDENVPELVEALGLEAGTSELTRLKQENATAADLKKLLDSALDGAAAMKLVADAKKQENFNKIKEDNAAADQGKYYNMY